LIVVNTGAINTARIMSIASSGMLLAWHLASQQIAQEIVGMLFSITKDPFWILVIVNIFLILNSYGIGNRDLYSSGYSYTINGNASRRGGSNSF